MANFTWPERVNIDDTGITKLQTMLKDTYAKVTRELSSASDFGVYNRQRILANIRAYLTDLGVDVNEFLRLEIPTYYTEGATDALKQLNELGSQVRVGFSMNTLNRQAIEALYSDASRSFGDAISGVARSAYRLLNVAVKNQITQDIAEGLTRGSAMRDTVKLIKGTLAEDGLTSLIDKSGRAWALDSYAEMLYRTKTAEARNLGMVNQMAANGYDLVQVSAHGATDVCGDWEGQVLSTTGATKTFNGEDVATVDEATADGLFHPNCRHALNAIADEQLAKDSYYYTGQYDSNGEPVYEKGIGFSTQE